MFHKLCVVFIIFFNFPNAYKFGFGLKQTLDDTIKKYINDYKAQLNMETKLLDEKRQRFKNGYFQGIKDGIGNPNKVEEHKMNLCSFSNNCDVMPFLQTNALMRKLFQDYEEVFTGMDAVQIISIHGYGVETHNIETNDGYLLTIQRILPNTNLIIRPNVAKQSVILHHGLLGSSEDWLLLDSGLALPYLLSDHGFDVWLLNARGNKYSRAHISRPTESYDFWDFSWHEIAIYDLSASLTYISKYTNDAELYYIGHSMGATVLLVLLSVMPEYNDKLKSAFFLAPLAFMNHAKGPLKDLAEYRTNSVAHVLDEGKFMIQKAFTKEIIDTYCEDNNTKCLNEQIFVANAGKEILNADLSKKLYIRVSAGSSAKTIIHFMQLISSGSFQMFDFGPLTNIETYGMEIPPSYNLTSISLPITLFSSTCDSLSNVTDIKQLLTKLKYVKVNYIIKNNHFSHQDFVWSHDAPELIYDRVIHMLEKSK